MKAKTAIEVTLLVAFAAVTGYWLGYEQGASRTRDELNVPSSLRQVGLSYRHHRNDYTGPFVVSSNVIRVAPQERRDPRPRSPDASAAPVIRLYGLDGTPVMSRKRAVRGSSTGPVDRVAGEDPLSRIRRDYDLIDTRIDAVVDQILNDRRTWR